MTTSNPTRHHFLPFLKHYRCRAPAPDVKRIKTRFCSSLLFLAARQAWSAWRSTSDTTDKPNPDAWHLIWRKRWITRCSFHSVVAAYLLLRRHNYKRRWTSWERGLFRFLMVRNGANWGTWFVAFDAKNLETQLNWNGEKLLQWQLNSNWGWTLKVFELWRQEGSLFQHRDGLPLFHCLCEKTGGMILMFTLHIHDKCPPELLNIHHVPSEVIRDRELTTGCRLLAVLVSL